MKLKRMLCALLSAVLVLGMSPPLSFAATGETDEDASAKKVTVKNASTAKKVIASLAKGKKVTVKVRAYKTIDGKKYYGTWSAAKTATVK